MDRETAVKLLIECQNDRDLECSHVSADDVLCKLLISLGYQDVVDEWKKIEKWYA